MPTKKKSGAENRKTLSQKAHALAQQIVSVGRSWLQQDAYRGSGVLFDPNAAPVQLPIYGAPPVVLIKQLQAVIIQLEQGAFFAAGILSDGMTRDDRIAAKCEERIDRVVGAQCDIAAADHEDNQERVYRSPAMRAAEDYKPLANKIVPPFELSQLMRYGLMLGVSFAQVIEHNSPLSRLPTFETWNPRYFYYDWTIRRFVVTTQNQNILVLDYANGFDYTDGAITSNGEDVQPTRWIVHQPFGPLGWLHGAKMRSVAIPFAIRYWTRTWWARFDEVHGQPLRLGVIPADRAPRDEAIFLSQLSNLAHEAVIRLPQGEEGNKFDVKLLEAAANGWENFEKLLAHCDDSIAIAFLGQSQSTKGQGGLGSQENAGESTMVRISRKDALISDTLRDQYIGPCWAEPNYGAADLAPFLKWQVDPPEDQAKTSKVDLTIAQALQAFKTATAPINVRTFLEERGYPLLTPKEEAAMKEQAIKDAQAAMGGEPGKPGAFGKKPGEEDKPEEDAPVE